jgi:hypothetical protein
MEGEWEKFTSNAPSFLKVRKIDVSKPQNRKMAQSYGVKGVPHIVREKNGIREVFNGPRIGSAFLQFALK